MINLCGMIRINRLKAIVNLLIKKQNCVFQATQKVTLEKLKNKSFVETIKKSCSIKRLNFEKTQIFFDLVLI
jgi:hypothetical protein